MRPSEFHQLLRKVTIEFLGCAGDCQWGGKGVVFSVRRLLRNDGRNPSDREPFAYGRRIGWPTAARIISFVQPAQHLYLRGSLIEMARLSPARSLPACAQDGHCV